MKYVLKIDSDYPFYTGLFLTGMPFSRTEGEAKRFAGRSVARREAKCLEYMVGMPVRIVAVV